MRQYGNELPLRKRISHLIRTPASLRKAKRSWRILALQHPRRILLQLKLHRLLRLLRVSHLLLQWLLHELLH